jgi:hypothetical protein
MSSRLQSLVNTPELYFPLKSYLLVLLLNIYILKVHPDFYKMALKIPIVLINSSPTDNDLDLDSSSVVSRRYLTH